MDLVNILSENKTILLLIPSTVYNYIILDIAKVLSKKNLCYVTLNKTQESLMEFFKKRGTKAENIVFIDAVTKTIKNVPQATANCYFVDSPEALGEMSMALSWVISKSLNKNVDYLIFDSVTNLLIYHGKNSSARFLSSVITQLEATDIKAVFYALDIKEHGELIKECSMFVDKVIDLGDTQK